MPLYDIFGSTIELVDAANPGSPVTNYTYDPYGVVITNNNNQRSPWPFLYHGLEQEYPDTWKLYWEPGGNVYNPDPFQLSAHRPAGARRWRRPSPRAVRGPGANPQVNLGLDIFDAAANAVALAGGIPISFYDYSFKLFLIPFGSLFGGGGAPEIPWYVTTHTSRGPPSDLFAVGRRWKLLVSQQSSITLAQFDEDDDEPGERLDLPKPISGVRGHPPRMPMNDFEYYDMRGVMNGFNEGETSRIMQGKVKDTRFEELKVGEKCNKYFAT